MLIGLHVNLYNSVEDINELSLMMYIVCGITF